MASEKHMQVYEFIKKNIENHGYPPKMREIGSACSISSTSYVYHNLKKLEDMGLIEREYKDARAIRLVGYRVELVKE